MAWYSVKKEGQGQLTLQYLTVLLVICESKTICFLSWDLHSEAVTITALCLDVMCVFIAQGYHTRDP
jgi:hypothetical protein